MSFRSPRRAKTKTENIAHCHVKQGLQGELRPLYGRDTLCEKQEGWIFHKLAKLVCHMFSLFLIILVTRLIPFPTLRLLIDLKVKLANFRGQPVQSIALID